MNLNQLRYFQKLAETQHYTKASQELFISQPSLTHAIKELEHELGVTLFDKKGRNVYLNENGRCFSEYVDQALKTLDHGIIQIQNRYKDEQKMIEASVIPTVVKSYFALIVKKMTEEHPEYKIQFHSEKTLDIIQGIMKNQYDFGICSKLEENGLKYIPLLSEEMVLITTVDHPLTKLEHITLADIANYPLITYHKHISIYKVVMDLFEKEKITPNVLYELDDETSIASMVSLDFGVAIVANNFTLNSSEQIQITHLDIDPHARLIYLVYNPDRPHSKIAMQFMNELMEKHTKL